MTDIELRHLAAMVAVADEGSFGRAAARLGYTQSTVSQQIAALERAVGGPVFDRPGGPKPVRITPLGTVVLEQGRDLLAKADRLVDAVDRFKAGGGRIDIGTFQSVSNVILPVVVRRLREEQPDCDIRLSEEEPDQPRIGDLDLLFYDGLIETDVEHVKLLDDPYFLVAGDGAFPDGPVRLEQLDRAPMVAWPLTCDQPVMEQALAGSGARPRVVFRSAINDTLLSMVRAGMGSTVLPLARDPRRRRPVRRSAPRPRAAAGPATTGDLPALAGRTHPVALGGAGHRDRCRGRGRARRMSAPRRARSSCRRPARGARSGDARGR